MTTYGPLPFVEPIVITREQELEALLEAARAEIARLKAKQKWIRCSERMPRTTELLCDKHYVLAIDAKKRQSVGFVKKYTGGWVWTFAKPISEPTHWQELPEPPKEEA